MRIPKLVVVFLSMLFFITACVPQSQEKQEHHDPWEYQGMAFRVVDEQGQSIENVVIEVVVKDATGTVAFGPYTHIDTKNDGSVFVRIPAAVPLDEIATVKISKEGYQPFEGMFRIEEIINRFGSEIDQIILFPSTS